MRILNLLPIVFVFASLVWAHLSSQSDSENWFMGYLLYLCPVLVFSFISHKEPSLLAKLSLIFGCIYALVIAIMLLQREALFIGPAFAISALLLSLAIMTVWFIYIVIKWISSANET